MRGLPSVEPGERFRARRWDAVVLGGALPGLISAVRLGMSGARVLVIEEKLAVDAFAGLREPFLVSGATAEGVLGQCLRALGISLIDRQRIGSDPLAYQVAFPDARLDIGERRRTCEELANWNFTSLAAADSLLRGLADAAAAERAAMLEAPVVRGSRRLPTAKRRTLPLSGAAEIPRPTRHARGLPADIADAPPALLALCAAQTRALSNLGKTAPSPEALARLLGLSQEGSALYAGGECWLHSLLKRRIEALYGEFRTVPGSFQLVSVSNHPGIALESAREVWCGRVLLLNAPRTALADFIRQDPLPEMLSAPRPTRRRLHLHLRTRRTLVPEGMARRVIAVRDPNAPMDGTNVISLRTFPSTRRDDTVDLVASAVVDAAESDLAAREAEIGSGVAELMPFAGDSFQRSRAASPHWDSDEWLTDPPNNGSWPAACEVRVASRPPIFALDRSGLGGLGFEGDVLLGWRTGDAVAAELG